MRGQGGSGRPPFCAAHPLQNAPEGPYFQAQKPKKKGPGGPCQILPQNGPEKGLKRAETGPAQPGNAGASSSSGSLPVNRMAWLMMSCP